MDCHKYSASEIRLYSGAKLVMGSTCFWLLLAILIHAAVGYSGKSLVDLEASETDSRILHRQRRFLIPFGNSTTPWVFVIRLTLQFPLEGVDAKFDGNIPFTWTFDPTNLDAGFT